jgi:glycerol-3-phosphate O-acyltransferase
MTSPAQGHAFVDEPDWPEQASGRTAVFLLDASSPLERSILEAWVARHCPEDGGGRMIALPASRRPGSGELDPTLEATLATDEEALLSPLRIAWLPPSRDGVRAVRLSDLLTLGDPRDPGPLRQRWLLRRHVDRCRIVAADGATIGELRQRWRRSMDDAAAITGGFAEFVARQAQLALERAERRIRGARYKVPKLVQQEILSRPAFRGELSHIARVEERSEAAIEQEAAADLKEIAATHSPFTIDIVAHLIRLLYTQGYGERLQYDREQLAGIASLSQRHPVVFLPTHKSNLDHLVLQYALHENGLPPNHTAGGINMNFFPVGPLVRRSGTFFIRRSFRDDAVYKHVLRSYIDYLIEKRFSLEWYMEGARSRSGKLLPPRFGMLAYVVDAWRRGKSDDVYLIPSSIAYDQIQDVTSYVEEQHGGAKQAEGFRWFVGVVRSLRRHYGKIHIRFGEPLSLRQYLGDPGPVRDAGPDDREIALQKLAFEVSVRINEATPITPTSLVTLAMLGTGDRALTVAEVRRGLANLLQSVQARKLPTTADFFRLESDDGICQTLDALVENDVVTRFDGGAEPVYLIGADQQLTAAYYRNTVIHFFVTPAIAELAILHVGEGAYEDPLQEFRDETLRLRDLLKFEFFFPDKDAFHAELDEYLRCQQPEWEQTLCELPKGPGGLVRSLKPYTAHRTLRPFLEAYQVVGDLLARLEPEQEVDESKLVGECLGLAKQYHLQHHIHSAASISKIGFENALKLARNRRLLEGERGRLSERRAAFAAEIRDALRRVEGIVVLAASRRTGMID